MKPSSSQEKQLRLAIAEKIGMDHRVALNANVEEFADSVYERCVSEPDERTALRDEVTFLRSKLKGMVDLARDGHVPGHFCQARDVLQALEARATHALRFPDL